jgi:AcrR family transcriptional regulator
MRPQDEHRRSTAEDTKGLILEKAIARFAQYGFGKTTLVEIARD